MRSRATVFPGPFVISGSSAGFLSLPVLTVHTTNLAPGSAVIENTGASLPTLCFLTHQLLDSPPAALLGNWTLFGGAAHVPALPWDSSVRPGSLREVTPASSEPCTRSVYSFMMTCVLLITLSISHHSREHVRRSCGLAPLQLQLPGCQRQKPASFTCCTFRFHQPSPFPSPTPRSPVLVSDPFISPCARCTLQPPAPAAWLDAPRSSGPVQFSPSAPVSCEQSSTVHSVVSLKDLSGI